MRAPRILFFYVMREVAIYTALAFAIVTIVLVSQNILRRLGDMVAIGFEPSDLQTVLLALVPMLAAYAIPVAFVVGTLFALRRLKGDAEILAMRTCGVGLSPLLAPTLVLALLASVLSGWVVLGVEHGARRELLMLFKTVAARGGIIEPGRFRAMDSRIIYVESRDREGRLHGIMISDRKNRARPFLIFAESGRLEFEEDSARIRIELSEGDLHLSDTAGAGNDASEEDPWSGRYKVIDFDRFEYAFDMSRIISHAERPVRPKQMTLTELEDVVAQAARGEELPKILAEKNPLAYAIEAQRRLAVPVAPILFALIAVPLGIAGPHTARAWSVLLGLAIVFGYYGLLSLGEFVAREAWISPAGAYWGPTLLLGLLGVLLVWWVERGR